MKKFILTLSVCLISLVLCAGNQEGKFSPADQTVMLIPTAYTMPKGMNAFTDIELVILQLTHAITNRVHLSAGMQFPFQTESFETFSVGSKINYLDIERLDSAAFFTYNPKHKLLLWGNTLSYGEEHSSMHFMAANLSNFEDSANNPIFGLGSIFALSKSTSFMAELFLIPPELDGSFKNTSNKHKVDTAGLFGFRFKGKKISWDLGGGRPLNEDMGDLLFIPFLKATVMF